MIQDKASTFFQFNPYRRNLVNSIYQIRLEAKNSVPCMIFPREGEFVPPYQVDVNKKQIDQLVDRLPAAKISSPFMETLVGFISYYHEKTKYYYRQYQLKSDYRLVLDLLQKQDYEHYPEETWRYFLQNWPDFCIIAFDDCNTPIGVVIGQRNGMSHGYIACLFVKKPYRRKSVGSILMKVLLNRMHKIGIREVIAEADTSNITGLLALYTRLSFCKERHLSYYYRNGWSAWRMKMWIHPYDLDFDKYKREVLEKIQYFKKHLPQEVKSDVKGEKNEKSSKSPKSPKSPKKGKK